MKSEVTAQVDLFATGLGGPQASFISLLLMSVICIGMRTWRLVIILKVEATSACLGLLV
jgi:hypothetical protein